MSYIYVEQHGKKIFIWERNNDSGLLLKKYDAEYYFYTRHKDGEYTDIYGYPLKKHSFENSSELQKAKKYYKESLNKNVYESDISATLKILSKHYYNKPAPKLHISLYDIEVDYNPNKGFPHPGYAYAPINALAIYNYWENKIYALAIPPNNQDPKDINNEKFIKDLNEIEKIEMPLELHLVSTEKELLKLFLKILSDSDIFLGWNSETFDNPYVAERILITLDGYTQKEINELEKSEDFGSNKLSYKNKFDNAVNFKKLSFRDALSPSRQFIEIFGENRPIIETYGRTAFDYMRLYKKFGFGERASFKLENIAEEELPTMRKLEYKGSLYDLYRNDFCKFVRYNIRDTEILHGFEEKLGFIALSNDMYHSTTGLPQHIFGTLKNTELAIINYCHYELNDLKVPDNIHDTSYLKDDLGNFLLNDEGKKIKQTIDGAYVLTPKIGQHKNVASIDMTSLYPSSIRSNNISPETIIGQFFKCKEDFAQLKIKSSIELTLYFEDNTKETKSAAEWYDWLKQNNFSISGYGTVFDLNKKGILPGLLEDWFNQRKKNKNLSFQLAKRAETENDPAIKAKIQEKSNYYDRIQMVNKLALNSAYGALCNEYFRFYDLRLGSSTTATGQELLKHQTAEVNRLLTGEYDMEGDSIIYGDTDSTYFKTYAKSEEEALKIGDDIGAKVNASFPAFMRKTFLCTDGFDNIIATDREVIASSGIFVGKKLYTMRVIDLEGKKVDKLKTMGLSLKKTTLSKEIQKKLSDIVLKILLYKDWNIINKEICDFRKELKHSNDILRIGLPIGVKKIEEYTKKYNDGLKFTKETDKFFDTSEVEKKSDTNLPGHIAASLHWNLARNEYKDFESMEIVSGTKIKVYYLKSLYYNNKFKSIAIPVDIGTIPNWFIKYYKDDIDIDAQMDRLIYKPLKNIFDAIHRIIPTESDEQLNELTDMEQIIDSDDVDTNQNKKQQISIEQKHKQLTKNNKLINELFDF